MSNTPNFFQPMLWGAGCGTWDRYSDDNDDDDDDSEDDDDDDDDDDEDDDDDDKPPSGSVAQETEGEKTPSPAEV